jgi:hypothetical protein
VVLVVVAGEENMIPVNVGVECEVDVEAIVVQGASSQERGVVSWVGRITQKVSSIVGWNLLVK